MVKELIVTADDFGMHEDFNDGILEAVKARRVTAVSVLVNGPALSEKYIEEIKKYVHSGQISLGLHVDLGKPKTWNSLSKTEKWTAASGQYASFNNIFDFFPQHIDGHYHVHLKDPVVFEWLKKVECYYHIYVRSREGEIKKLKSQGFNTCDYFLNSSKDSIQNLIPHAKNGLNELMVHIGFCKPNKEYPTSLTTKRREDLDYLLSAEFGNLLKKYKIICVKPESNL